MQSLTGNIIDAGDVLIIGAGLAGIFTALKMQPRPVTIMSAGKRNQGAASAWAQGGIAAPIGPEDSIDAHAHDTLSAGAGLVDSKIAHLLAAEAEARIDDLCNLGVPFSTDAHGNLKLGREAAHSQNRIIGVSGDRAGHEVMQTLLRSAESNPAIRFLEGLSGYELAVENDRVVGVFAHRTFEPSHNAPLLIKARAVIIATGGSGHLYDVTTNPIFANGEAIAMAARAGARVRDVEFVQFHPTAFTGLGDPAPLATEALRGEGAWLVNAEGERFMTDIHPDAELAPRDIVARAVFRERQRCGFVGLDLRRPELRSFTDNFDQHFPTVAETCKQAGIDPRRDILPVAPAAHYHMGGVRTDINGRASLEGLWVCGEAASTGAHGANRLASNSLLEALVFAARIAKDVNNLIPWRSIATPQPPQSQLSEQDENALPTIHQLRSMMSAHVGVERDETGLRDMLIHLMRLEKASMGRAPMINMVSTALLITAAAYQRQESRGAHFRKDFKDHLPDAISSDLTLDDARIIAKAARNREGLNSPKHKSNQVR